MNPSVAPPALRGSPLWLAVGTLWWRELVRFYRYRSRVVGALGTPLVFWLLIGSGIGSSFRPSASSPGMHYLEYFFPGTVMLILLFTSIFCMISVIEDRHEGFLLSVLVAPVSRASLVLGKILGGATLAVAQALLFVLLAPAVGLSLGLLPLLFLTGVLFLSAFALTALGFAVAWKLDTVQGFHAVVNLFLIPLWLLSGALFPASGASVWVRWVMQANPLTYAMAAVRQVFYLSHPGGSSEGPSLALSLGVTVGFAMLAGLASFLIAERPGRSDWG